MFTDFAVTTNKERCCSSWHADKLLDSAEYAVDTKSFHGFGETDKVTPQMSFEG